MANVNYPTANSQKVVNVWNNDCGLSDEGGYFITTNPTVGTAIAMTTSVVDDAATASSTHAQFAPVALIYNGDSTANQNAVSIYMRYIRLTLSQVPTTASNWRYAMRLDNLNRYSSGGSTLTPVNVNSGAAAKSPRATVYFGAIVPTALPSASSRLVANGTINPVIPVINDQWLFTFGNSAPTMDQLQGGATAKNMVYNASPIIIAPNWCLSLEMWGTACAAAPFVGIRDRPRGAGAWTLRRTAMANAYTSLVQEDGYRNAVVEVTGILDTQDAVLTPAVALQDFVTELNQAELHRVPDRSHLALHR